MRPHVYKENGPWWVRCKHGQRTGPYDTFFWAKLTASSLWEAYGD